MLIECVKPYRKESEILKLSTSTKIATAEGWQIYHHKKKAQEAVTAVMDGNDTWHYDKTYDILLK